MSSILDDIGINITNALGLTKKAAPVSTGTTDIFGNPSITTKSALPSTTPAIATQPSNSLELQTLQAQIAAIQAQAAATPKLPTLNTSDLMAKANATATAAVNPVYQDKLNNQLERYATQLSQEQAQTSTSKAAEDTSLAQTQEDDTTQAQRTAQDTQTAIDKSLYNEGQFQTSDAASFDLANKQAREAVSNAGLTESGLGKQSLEKLQSDRNAASTAQTKDFSDDRATQQLLATRTFEDLGTKDTRATELNATNKANLDTQLNNFITNQAEDQRDFELQNESDRQAAVYDASNSAYQTSVQQWIAGLSAAGWRPQDIALAAQVYA